MNICRNCGNQLPDYMRSCNFCGTPVDGNAQPAQNTDPYSQQYAPQNTDPYSQQYAPQGQNQYSYQTTDPYAQPNPYNQPDPYNSYPVQSPAAAKPNKGLSTMIIALLIIIGVAAAGSIAYMVLTGYYDLSSISSSGNSTAPAVIPESYGVIDRDDINTSNTVNGSGVYDAGDCYYTISGGGTKEYEIRRYAAGSKESDVLYSSPYIIMSLGVYGNRIYFLEDNGEKGIVCSMSKKGKDIKTEIDDYDIYGLYIYGSNAYFYANNYGESGESGLVGKLDLKTKKKDIVTIVDYSTILGVLEYKGYLYIHYSNNNNYRAHLLRSQAEYPSVTTELSPVGGLDEDIYSLTVSGGKIYFSNIRSSGNRSYRSLYSMDPDGTNITKIADTAGSYMIGYGDYIFYTQITYGDDESKKTYEVRQIKNDGSGDGYLSSQHVMYPGIAGERIYFYDMETSFYSWMSLDGRSSGNI